MVRLVRAWWLVNKVPFARWKGRLLSKQADQTPDPAQIAESRRLAIHVERAAARLPFATRCLPRALALSAMLRARNLPHRLVVAARPAEDRQGQDDLHAWIESGTERVLGDLPGPWLPISRTSHGQDPR